MSSIRFVRRTAFFGLLLPFLYFGTASATFLYRIHAENSDRTRVPLPTTPAPTARQRIVVFSPHCDDETLGCSGLLQQAIRAGADARVIFITNGDGFRVAVEREYRTTDLEPGDYVQFASLRQEETYRALAKDGLSRDSIQFLGYPDRGLMRLWNDFWSADVPYTSPYTRCSHSPYKLAYHPGAPYCGESLLADIKDVLRRARPTEVYVTHPSDDHPDHAAASAFVTLALRELKAEGLPWARRCRLHYYLVHRGDWPAPQGLQKEDALVPPAEMAALDTHWSSRPLTERQTDRKEQSILAYASQTAIMKRFLLSFARRNELFGDINDSQIARVPDGAIQPDGNPSEWKGIRPAILDPVNDNLLRDFQAGGDIRTVYACRDTRSLYLRIDTSSPATNRLQYTVRLRYFGDPDSDAAGGSYTATVRAPGVVVGGTARAGVSGNHVEVAIPLRDLGYAHCAALNVETSVAGLQIDRTGYRFLDL